MTEWDDLTAPEPVPHKDEWDELGNVLETKLLSEEPFGAGVGRDQKYILRDGEVVPVDLITWAKWFESAPERRIKRDTIKRDGVTYAVSTVFLGLDHGFDSEHPLLFETMVFAGSDHADLYCDRYETMEQARAGHDMACKQVRMGRIKVSDE